MWVPVDIAGATIEVKSPSRGEELAANAVRWSRRGTSAMENYAVSVCSKKHLHDLFVIIAGGGDTRVIVRGCGVCSPELSNHRAGSL